MLSITREDAVVFGIAMRDWTADQVEEFVNDSAILAAITGRHTPDVMMDAILAAVDLMEDSNKDSGGALAPRRPTGTRIPLLPAGRHRPD